MGLSKRQQEVANRIIVGWTNKEIAAELGISVSTVKQHLMDIFHKLGVRNRTELAMRMRRQAAE